MNEGRSAGDVPFRRAPIAVVLHDDPSLDFSKDGPDAIGKPIGFSSTALISLPTALEDKNV